MLLFHVTTEEAVSGILRDGLAPRLGPRAISAAETEPAVWFFASREALNSAAWNWLSEEFEDEPGRLVVLEVAVPSHHVQASPGVDVEVTVPVVIPPESVVRAYDIDTGADIPLAGRR